MLICFVSASAAISDRFRCFQQAQSVAVTFFRKHFLSGRANLSPTVKNILWRCCSRVNKGQRCGVSRGTMAPQAHRFGR